MPPGADHRHPPHCGGTLPQFKAEKRDSLFRIRERRRNHAAPLCIFHPEPGAFERWLARTRHSQAIVRQFAQKLAHSFARCQARRLDRKSIYRKRLGPRRRECQPSHRATAIGIQSRRRPGGQALQLRRKLFVSDCGLRLRHPTSPAPPGFVHRPRRSEHPCSC